MNKNEDYTDNMKSCKQKILENSGQILTKLNKENQIFYVLEDSEKNRVITQKLQKASYTNVICVSYRWVQFCIKHNNIIYDYVDKKMYNLFYIPHKVPFPDFAAVSIGLLDFDVSEKNTLREVIQIIGAQIAESKR